MSTITTSERINLKKLVEQSDCEDNTEHIRTLKHSGLLRSEIKKMEVFEYNNIALKTSNNAEYLELLQQECAFLYNNYTDIFNRLVKDELDMKIMARLLIVLKLIEDGAVDQHEGSVMVGKVLKELYIDSAIKRSDNLDKEYEDQKPQINNGEQISYSKYKMLKRA